MAVDAYVNEIVQLFKKIYTATRNGSLDWEPTADPNIITAPLGEDYFVRLALVSDFDGNPDENDHTVFLLKGQEQLLHFDRRDFGENDLVTLFSTGITNNFHLFNDLWTRAGIKSKQLDKHFTLVNRLLDKKLGMANGSE